MITQSWSRTLWHKDEIAWPYVRGTWSSARPLARIRSHRNLLGFPHGMSPEDNFVRHWRLKFAIWTKKPELQKLSRISNSFPGSSISPPQREWGRKYPGSGWSRVLVTNLSSLERSQFKVLSPLPFVTHKTGLLGGHGKLSFDFAATICHIYIIHCFHHLKLNLVWKL